MSLDKLLDGRFKIRHLVLITTIAEEGSLVAAARALHVTQPVVTRSLREIEDVLGVALFTRGPRGVRTTPFGDMVLEHARAVLANLRRVSENIEHIQRGGGRPVHVGTNLAGSSGLLPQALAEFKRTRPRTQVTVVEGTADDLIKALRRNETDFVVGRLTRDLATAPDLRQQPLYDEPVRIAVRRGHPAARASEPAIEHLVKYPWILPGPGTQLRLALDTEFSSRALPPPADLIECSTFLTIREILLATDAVAPLPLLIARRDEHLAVLPTPLAGVAASMGVAQLADASVGENARALLTLIHRTAQDINIELGMEP
ncbi:LysR substrate-binding domain-containing protein [Amycolatopsis sp. NPDC006131]|uniref:LysR substrate-binding domain-containing protein n=1 Tax=Amycolatopsis sp. NPDC006131 TaxID=3156731 RepID=UPI0033AD7C06